MPLHLLDDGNLPERLGTLGLLVQVRALLSGELGWDSLDLSSGIEVGDLGHLVLAGVIASSVLDLLVLE